MNFRILCSTLLACLTFIPAAYAKGFDFNELYANQANPYYRTYDFIFPALASAMYIKPDMTSTEKLDAALDFVTFYSTPSKFDRYQGLGTGMNWKEGATVLMRSGNLLCSEQSSLAAMMLRPYVNGVVVRDAQSHTFHEVVLDGRQVIVDPYADNHLRNGQDLPVTFQDVQRWLNGDTDALQLPSPLSARLKRYLSLFRSDNYNSPRQPFGQTFAIEDPGYDFMVGLPVQSALYSFKQRRMNINDPNFSGYRYYVRNNVYAYLKSRGFTSQAIWNVQDFFFSLLKRDVERGALKAELADNLFFARGYQLLGRYDMALEIFRQLPQSDMVDFFMAQCLFKMNDMAAFKKLSGTLESNAYYRVMYYQLTGDFLKESDPATFDTFLNRDARVTH